MNRETLLSVPNAISMSRFVLAAAFVVFTEPRARLGVIAAASATDVLDGWWARRSKTASQWGALLDPLADRVFVFTAVCVYLLAGALTTVQYFIVISRDLATAVGFIVARSVSWLRPIHLRARPMGKTVTVLQLITLVVVLALPEAVPQLVALVGIASVIAIVDYTLTLWRERARA